MPGKHFDMEENTKIDAKFKKEFNLGYQLAQELNLKAPLLEHQEKVMASNPMHLGMQQYINEVKLNQKVKQENQIDLKPDSPKRKGRSL